MIFPDFVAAVFDSIVLVSGTYCLTAFFSYKIKDVRNWFSCSRGDQEAQYMLFCLY